jgi:ABC-type polysaccharide/polyol phosphate transport system ATPase subunit
MSSQVLEAAGTTTAGDIQAAEPSIELRGVGVRYRLLTERARTLKGRVLSMMAGYESSGAEFWALRDLNLSISAGQVLGIVGSNGSGKSTMLRVIARIIEPAEGEVTTAGRITPVMDLTSTLNPDFSGRENAFIFGALHGVPHENVAEWIPRIAEFTELGPFFDVPIKAYSSGMAARLAFALSSQLQPEILLLDEVLSVGDERFQRKCYFRVRKLIDRGKLVVIVSHNLSLLEHLCTRVVLLSAGRIAADGNPSRVIAEYRRITA